MTMDTGELTPLKDDFETLRFEGKVGRVTGILETALKKSQAFQEAAVSRLLTSTKSPDPVHFTKGNRTYFIETDDGGSIFAIDVISSDDKNRSVLDKYKVEWHDQENQGANPCHISYEKSVDQKVDVELHGEEFEIDLNYVDNTDKVQRENKLTFAQFFSLAEELGRT